jgi:DNA-binding protein HU-beta
MSNYTKKELIEELSNHDDLIEGKKAGAKRVLDFVIETVLEQVSKGNSVDISGLGKFYPHNQAEKTGTVPGTDKTYVSPAKVVPKFKASVAFKTAVNVV